MVNYQKMEQTLFLLLMCTAVANATVCPENFCDNQECKEVSCGLNQEVNPRGTFCGCCPACVTIVGKLKNKTI